MPDIASEVLVAGTGGLYRAPLGTAKPADSTIALDPAFEGLGFFSSDGVPISFNDSVDNIIAWQGAVVVRSTITETLTTIAFTPIQTRGSVLETFHPGSVVTEPTTGNFEIAVKPRVATPQTWVFDAIDGTKHIRYYIPNGEVTERGEIMHANGEPIGYPMTITFYPDGNGNIMEILSNDAAFGLGLSGS